MIAKSPASITFFYPRIFEISNLLDKNLCFICWNCVRLDCNHLREALKHFLQGGRWGGVGVEPRGDKHAYCAGHNHIVVAPGYGSETAAWLMFIPSKLIDGAVAVLGVAVVAHESYQMEYRFGLGLAVGVEAQTVALSAI